MEQEQMNYIMGIGPVIQLTPDVKKTLRVGSIKQIKEVGALYKDNLTRIKHAAVFLGEEEQAKTFDQWTEILNMVFIEGFERSQIEDFIPEVLEEAVERFLFSK